MAWFVFTEDELAGLEAAGRPEMAESFREAGFWTDEGTLVVNADGIDSTMLVAIFDKYPRRLARDPPVTTNAIESTTLLDAQQ